MLCETAERLDADTLIDVHTHPFCRAAAAFSAIDDADERRFAAFLHERFDGLHYASLVLSRSDYAARLWHPGSPAARPLPAAVRTQTAFEAWPCAQGEPRPAAPLDRPFLSRTALALGLDALRRIAGARRVVVIGAGGLGSLLAENLVHMGFHDLALVDPDTLELSNLNRIAGAYHADAVARRPKVEVVARHLRNINPEARIDAFACAVEDERLLPVLAGADWLVAATDNHSSRFYAQRKALQYFVPLLSVGVNITVADGRVSDMSGEVITVRAGDGLCLNCLGRLNPIKIAAERHPSAEVREQLVARGYVDGQHVGEPAVKTLNAILAALAVDALVNQYTGRRSDMPVLVYENNRQPAIYVDQASIEARNKACFSCGL